VNTATCKGDISYSIKLVKRDILEVINWGWGEGGQMQNDLGESWLKVTRPLRRVRKIICFKHCTTCAVLVC